MELNLELTKQTGARKTLYPLLAIITGDETQIAEITNCGTYIQTLNKDISVFKSRNDGYLLLEMKPRKLAADFLINIALDTGTTFDFDSLLKFLKWKRDEWLTQRNWEFK